jgi:hypothetical protein
MLAADRKNLEVKPIIFRFSSSRIARPCSLDLRSECATNCLRDVSKEVG